MTALRVRPGRGPLRGDVRVPGDKSVGHRALLLGAIADGTTLVRGFPGGADVRATLGAIRALGAEASWTGDEVRIAGAGLDLGKPGPLAIDCANSGTTMRLGAGLIAGHAGDVTLDGDASLRRRPMERIAAPLRAMGALVDTTAGRAPMRVRGGGLHAVAWTLPVASAQIKSAVLLAGLRADGITRVHEPLPSRDHTERMLRHLGVRVDRLPDGAALAGGQRLTGAELPLPGDPSSAAFLVVAALLVPGSSLCIRDVCVNPTRTGALDILRRMGGDVVIENECEVAGEPRGDVVVRGGGTLRATAIGAAEVPAAIDELPILAVAAAFAEGETRITGAAELRIKESDRLAALEQLRGLGVAVEAQPDGLVIGGDPGRALAAGRIATHGDHRIAMAFAVAGLRAPSGVAVDDADCVDVSFPGFFDRLRVLGALVDEP